MPVDNRLLFPDFPIRTQLPPYSLRERVEQFGIEALENGELLEILLNPPEHRRQKIRQAIAQLTLSFLTLADIQQLVYHLGFTEREARILKAAAILAKRLSERNPKQRITISTPNDAARLLMPEMRYLDREHLRVVCLDSKNQIIANELISVGTVNCSLAHPRECYKPALIVSAVAVIFAHNHPSGDPTPSSEDIQLTKQLKSAADVLCIDLLDHIVIGDGVHVSLKERGQM